MSELPDRIADLIEEGRTIEAIKELRAATGASLGEAKAAVEVLARGAAPETDDGLDADGLDDRVAALVAEGRVIEAIKEVREQTGAPLADAKAFVDRHRGPAEVDRTLSVAIGVVLAIGLFVAAALALWAGAG